MSEEQTTQHTATQPASTEQAQPQTPAEVQAAQSAATKSTTTSATTTEAASAEPASLLAGEGATTQASETAKPAEITPEAIDAMLGSIDLKFKPEGMEQQVEIDKEEVKTVLPELMKLGATKEQIASIAKLNAAHRINQMRAAQQKDAEFMGQMVAKTKSEFGADLPMVIQAAKLGGRKLFGDQLWKELSEVPAFSNDHRIIAALSAYGKSIKPDTGTDGGGASGGSQKDFVTTWTGKPGGVG